MSAKRQAQAPARFGLPVKTQRPGGTAIRIEIIPKRGEFLYSLREGREQESAFPIDFLEFGEDFDQAVRRILKQRLKATLDSFWISTVKSHVDGLSHWALTIVAVAEIDEPKAKKGFKLEEFTESTIPAGLEGWSSSHLRDALSR